MFNPGQSLVSESHHKEPNPAEDLRVGMGIDFVEGQCRERTLESDAQEQDRAPYSAGGHDYDDARLEKPAVDRVGQLIQEIARGNWFFVADRVGVLNRGIEFVNDLPDINAVGAGEVLD